jgi:hypothetical protein
MWVNGVVIGKPQPTTNKTTNSNRFIRGLPGWPK